MALAFALFGLAFGLVPAGLLYNVRAEMLSDERYPAPGLVTLAGDLRLHYLCDGDGDPQFALLHAAPGSLVDFSLLLPALAERSRVCAVDAPGYGWSETPAAALGPSATAERLREAYTALRLYRPVLVGHSLGGAAALAYAAAHPGDVRGLVLLDPTTPFEAESVRRDFAALAQIRFLLPFGVSHLAEAGTAEALLQQRPSGHGEMTLPLAQQIAAANARTRVVQYMADSADSIAGDLRALSERLTDVRIPVLILAPSDQPTERRAALERLRQALAFAQLEVVADSRHYLQLAQPDAVAQRIRQFAEAP